MLHKQYSEVPCIKFRSREPDEDLNDEKLDNIEEMINMTPSIRNN